MANEFGELLMGQAIQFEDIIIAIGKVTDTEERQIISGAITKSGDLPNALTPAGPRIVVRYSRKPSSVTGQ